MPIDPKSFDSFETDADADAFSWPTRPNDDNRRIKVIFKLLAGEPVPEFVELVSTSAERHSVEDVDSVNTAWIRQGDIMRLKRHRGVVSVIPSTPLHST